MTLWEEKILQLKSELKRLPLEEESAKLRLVDDQASKDKIDKLIQVNEVGIKSLELDIETRRDTISKLKVQQFETRKNDEYQALNHEIDRYQDDISNLEDSELELMESGEQLATELTQAKKTLQDTHEGVKIALVTANVQLSIQEKADSLGVAFIAKPVTEEKISNFLDQCLFWGSRSGGRGFSLDFDRKDSPSFI